MTVSTNIPETPMAHTEKESILKSMGKKHHIPLELIQHVFKTVMGLFDDKQGEDLSHWIHYREYYNFDDMYDTFCHNPEDVHKCEEYKWNGEKDCISLNITQKVKSFIQWMNMKDDIYILHDHFLISFTGGDYMEFRKMDIEPMPNTRSSHTEPPKPMTTFYGHTKPTTISESQTALNNFKKGTKRDASPYPIFNNDLYYDTFQRPFLAIIKAQGLYDVADQYDKELFKEKQVFVCSVLVTSLQTEKGRELVKELEEMQDPSFQISIIIILSQMLHNMKLSL